MMAPVLLFGATMTGYRRVRRLTASRNDAFTTDRAATREDKADDKTIMTSFPTPHRLTSPNFSTASLL